mmetsp:Transcript_3520/g.7877  ORF Transcript_3520/g.7877 Transcript_3520/m.7877 type:complete len:376 (-) Transcript_3520:1062-2189(-)
MAPSALEGGGRMRAAIIALISSSTSYTTSYSLMLMLSLLASSLILLEATTLKPTIVAAETEASSTSSDVISPAPSRSTRVRTCSLSSAVSSSAIAWLSACAEPCTSALTTMSMTRSGSWSLSPERKELMPSLARAAKSSEAFFSRSSCWRTAAISRAADSSSVTVKTSPALGSPPSPTSSTADDGPAMSRRAPLSSSSAFTRPHCDPATTMSPTRSEPFCTSAEATAPCPTMLRASSTVPEAMRSGLARRLRSDACSSTCSRSASSPCPVLAETSVESTSPPKSSSTISCCSSPCLTMSAVASCLSILLMATTTGTPAALAALIDAIVCSLTPSSAATTRMITSVRLAPRWRICEKAACPGVSSIVMLPSRVVSW